MSYNLCIKSISLEGEKNPADQIYLWNTKFVFNRTKILAKVTEWVAELGLELQSQVFSTPNYHEVIW